MRNRTFIAIVFGSMTAASACIVPRAEAAPKDALAPAVAEALDRADAEFTRHNRAHRMAEIQWNLERQRYGRRGYGPPPGYGRGYGPPPGYGYGYGYRRGYGYGPPRGYYRDWDDD